MKTSIKFLDCSLRDGGYYNDWDFSLEDAQEYIDGLVAGGVKLIEIGFRFTPKAKFLGPFAYTPESLLEKLRLPDNVTFGVMINAADYLKEDGPEVLDRAFVPAEQSAVKLVRIAAHLRDVSRCDWIVSRLKALGYIVGLNIMQISQADDATISELVRDIEDRFVDFEALYFADSLGKMTGDDVRRIIDLFRQQTKKEIGFHGHDNIGTGVSNTLTAIEAGATWVDATVTGIGRGAGNTQTEYLAIELSRRGLADLDTLHIGKVAVGWLGEMQRKCQWGKNIYYYEAALRSIHPTYVQEIITSNNFEPVDILVTLRALEKLPEPASYAYDNINTVLAEQIANSEGDSDINDIWRGAPVVLVGGGPNAKKHWPRIVEYANKHDARIVAINHVDFVDPKILSGVVVLHPARLAHLAAQQDWRKTPVFTSVKAFPESFKRMLDGAGVIYDYAADVRQGKFQAMARGCQIPRPLAAFYGMAVARAAGASEVWLAGLDGYDGVSHAFQEMNSVLTNGLDDLGIGVSSLTQTHYDIPIRSIYGEI